MKKGSKEYERELEASFPKVLDEADALYEGRGRLQDLADVERLIQEHNLTEAFADTLHPYVRAKFLELK